MSDARPDTDWRVRCYTHGDVCLTREEVSAQMLEADAKWVCPECGESALWDYVWHEKRLAYLLDVKESE